MNRVAAALAVAIAFAACSSGPGPTRSFGHHGEWIALTPTDAQHKVSHAAAKVILDHPLTQPTLVKPHVVFEGLVRLHAVGVADVTGSSTEAHRAMVGVSTLEGHVVWVRVTRGTVRAISCPLVRSGVPTIPGERIPPVDYATIVDANTGAEADWSETLVGNPCPRERQ